MCQIENQYLQTKHVFTNQFGQFGLIWAWLVRDIYIYFHSNQFIGSGLILNLINCDLCIEREGKLGELLNIDEINFIGGMSWRQASKKTTRYKLGSEVLSEEGSISLFRPFLANLLFCSSWIYLILSHINCQPVCLSFVVSQWKRFQHLTDVQLILSLIHWCHHRCFPSPPCYPMIKQIMQKPIFPENPK